MMSQPFLFFFLAGMRKRGHPLWRSQNKFFLNKLQHRTETDGHFGKWEKAPCKMINTTPRGQKLFRNKLNFFLKKSPSLWTSLVSRFRKRYASFIFP